MLIRTMFSHGLQKLFPREFQIDPGSGVDLDDAIREIARAIRTGPEKPPEVETGFITALCGELYRIRRNSGLLSKGGANCKELRTIERAIERLDRVLGEKQIEYFDLEGRTWDDRHLDFDFFGQPEEVVGLIFKRIGPCECPLVKIRGKIVQRARGILQVPVRSPAGGSDGTTDRGLRSDGDNPCSDGQGSGEGKQL